MEVSDIRRVIRALAGVVAAVQSMVQDGMEAEDIEKSVRARGAYAR
jgi:hypothetical protein